ncbi:MAG TPA: DUF488 domain-containing protein [Candidatus Saccharimonadales bacterium]|nr:DUF488 domain-containing protein [Candidatus Saccharimonadales bacterium]
MKLYTVGYGGRRPEELVELLRQHGVATVADVRIRPDKASEAAFARANGSEAGIQKLFADAGIGYALLLELGNPFYEMARWREPYWRLLDLAGDLLVERLMQLPRPFCLLCSERLVANCHRQLIAEYLTEGGWTVEHLE